MPGTVKPSILNRFIYLFVEGHLNDAQRKEIGRRIKKQRKSLNLRQQELGEKADISRQIVIKLESGKPGYTPNLYTITKICNVLNLKIEALFKGIDDIK